MEANVQSATLHTDSRNLSTLCHGKAPESSFTRLKKIVASGEQLDKTAAVMLRVSLVIGASMESLLPCNRGRTKTHLERSNGKSQ